MAATPKANRLPNANDGRETLADDKLQKVLGKDKVTMFEVNKHLAQHLKLEPLGGA